MRIKVEVKNKILGDGVFWEGPASNVHEIRNIPARETAKLVAQDGRNRVCGMWHVSVLMDKGDPALPSSGTERLVKHLQTAARNIRPPSIGQGQAENTDHHDASL